MKIPRSQLEFNKQKKNKSSELFWSSNDGHIRRSNHSYKSIVQYVFFHTMTKHIHISSLTNCQAANIYVFGHVREMIENFHVLSLPCWWSCTVLQQHQHDCQLCVMFNHNELPIPITHSTNYRVDDRYMVFFVNF